MTITRIIIVVAIMITILAASVRAKNKRRISLPHITIIRSSGEKCEVGITMPVNAHPFVSNHHNRPRNSTTFTAPANKHSGFYTDGKKKEGGAGRVGTWENTGPRGGAIAVERSCAAQRAKAGKWRRSAGAISGINENYRRTLYPNSRDCPWTHNLCVLFPG
jgi:hypothetical protein